MVIDRLFAGSFGKANGFVDLRYVLRWEISLKNLMQAPSSSAKAIAY